ncbi:hypothetical protein AVEN_238604-1 [Araneus ventricosus]|uniref:Uncharacterized protein n=1 Tax=Araneus ventricosus TaxID=182803 RepID=A0A4Y2GP60_ARAVE|nr:hypothetical protein AVEN_238604-1 [Araneus ventricosus]
MRIQVIHPGLIWLPEIPVNSEVPSSGILVPLDSSSRWISLGIYFVSMLKFALKFAEIIIGKCLFDARNLDVVQNSGLLIRVKISRGETKTA